MEHDIRKYQELDLANLAEIYRTSILHIGDECYSKDQIAAWSSFPEDRGEFEKWIVGATTFVAVKSDNTCIGFGGLEDNCRISSLFVAPEWMRKGIGSRLLECLLEEAKSRDFTIVTTEASEFSKPLFQKYKFFVTGVEYTEFKGVEFNRDAMQVRI